MSQPTTLPGRGALLLLALCAALLLYRLGAVPLVGPDEPRYSRVAVEMARSGDLVTPTLQGVPWLEKPVLYYWLAAAAFSAIGESEAAARLPSVVALLLTVMATMILGARLYGCRAGLLAGSIAGLSLLAFAYGRAASMDMLLTAWVTVGLGLLALRRLGIAGPGAAVAGGACLGLATLAKGPLGLLLALLVLVPHWLLTRGRVRGLPLLTPGAAAAFVAVALPWYALALLRHGRAFVDTFFLHHNLERFTSTVHHHPGSFLYYVPVLLLGLFPWTGLLLPAAARFDPRSPVDLLLGCWTLLPFLFFSAAGSKLPGYILPIVPPLAVLMGRGADALLEGVPLRRGLGRGAVALVGLALALALGAAPVLARLPHPALRIPLYAPAAWGVLALLAASVRLGAAPADALKLLRVAAAGFLLLLATVAPAVLPHIESGRDLFPAAVRGHRVLAWGAWRTAWMAGYFYNDGLVTLVEDEREIVDAARREPVFVLCGASERARLETMPELEATPLVTGVRRNTMLRVTRR